MAHTIGEASSSRAKRQKKDPRSGFLFDLDVLDCPICCAALTGPIFQCDNGHVSCSSCCAKLRYRCSFCKLPIGNYRCRVVEKVIESILVPCPNAKHGCTKKISYVKEEEHKKECEFSLNRCPAPFCNYYADEYKYLFTHYRANHKNTMKRFLLYGD